MDNNRPQLQYIGRSNFHITHVMNANAIYELPFGINKRWINGGGLSVNVLAGGWQVSTIVALQSGAPLTIYSGRGTFNRAGRSNCGTTSVCNTAVTSLSVKEIQKHDRITRCPTAGSTGSIPRSSTRPPAGPSVPTTSATPRVSPGRSSSILARAKWATCR
jgi:hypothetical protein